ncbi:MAG: MarR family transcriptional regulator [Marinifilaceae bacterium]
MEEEHYEMYEKLLKVNNLISAQMHELFKNKEVTRSQYNVLKTLGDIYPNSCNAKYIKENILVNAPDVTRLLDRLILKGLIVRKRDDVKRRQIEIKITKKGLDILGSMGSEADFSIDNLQKVSLKEAKSLNKILGKILN